MARFLRINNIQDISPSDVDGHIFRLSLDVGEIIGSKFIPNVSQDFDVTISGTLQTMWDVPDSQLSQSTGSVAASTVIERLSQGNPNPFQKLDLNSFSAPRKPPEFKIASPGTLIPIPETEQQVQPKEIPMLLTSLSDDISAIRDNINTLSKNLLGERILELPQERSLIDMYKEARSSEQFSSRIQSLASLVIAINKEVVLKAFKDNNKKEITVKHKVGDANQIAPLVLLEELLTIYSNADRAKKVTEVFKKINHLRQGFPVHGDNAERVLTAHDFFKLRYPIEDFTTAWDAILGKYFEAMKEFLDIISNYRYETIGNGE